MAEPTVQAAAQAVSFSTAVPLLLIAVVFIALALFLIARLRKVLENTVLGVLALIAINLFGSGLGVQIPITLFTVLACAVLGLAGVGALIILALLGVKI